MGPFETVSDMLFLSILPLMALVALSDRGWRLSSQLASFFHFRRPDGMLLVFTLLTGLAWLILFFVSNSASWATGLAHKMVVGPPSYHKPEYEAFMAEMDRRRTWVMLYLYADMAALLLCPLVSAWLAFRQKRSVILWFVMGIFGTIGAIIRLLAEQKKAPA
jgi:hypothetical protein